MAFMRACSKSDVAAGDKEIYSNEEREERDEIVDRKTDRTGVASRLRFNGRRQGVGRHVSEAGRRWQGKDSGSEISKLNRMFESDTICIGCLLFIS